MGALGRGGDDSGGARMDGGAVRAPNAGHTELAEPAMGGQGG